MTTTAKIAVIGAGVLGRLLAWQLLRKGHSVSLYDRNARQPNALKPGETNQLSAGYTAAGMLSPFSELESADLTIFELGMRSLTLWADIEKSLDNDIDFRQSGSVIVAHPQDNAELELFNNQIAAQLNTSTYDKHLQRCDENWLRRHAPHLIDNFSQALFIRDEACLAPTALMQVLEQALLDNGVEWHENTAIDNLSDNLSANDARFNAVDFIVDCRGLGAKADLPPLRGVRGETILMYAPEVDIQHIVRLMHPRYQLYLVPRKNQHYIIGATQIESDQSHPVTVRSALELLSAAYSIHSGFAEAQIIACHAACRPAMPDNLPYIEQRGRLIRANGLYRHGVLISPAIAEKIIALIEQPAQLNESIVNEPTLLTQTA